MSTQKSICLFCGSSNRVDEKYKDAARQFGTVLGQKGIRLIYGGGRVGLMGIAADAALKAGGEVVGIIPQFLDDYEVGHNELTELIITDSMHSRKQKMYEKADAFVSLPGGLGTLDETFEVLTWTQLKLSAKPVVLLDLDGFWQDLAKMVQGIVSAGFASEANLDLFKLVENVGDILPAIEQFPVSDSPADSKWI